jgi:hypothetical protein
MTDQQRTALDLLAELWALSPDVRLGQLMAHLDFLCLSHLDNGMAYVDDDELLAIMYRHRAELTDRLQGTTCPTADPSLSVSGSSTLPKT